MLYTVVYILTEYSEITTKLFEPWIPKNIPKMGSGYPLRLRIEHRYTPS